MMNAKKYFLPFFCIFLFTCCMYGNYKIISSYGNYKNNVELLTSINLGGVDRYFEDNLSMPREKVVEFVTISSQRDLEQAYFIPWYYFQILIFNLVLLVVGYVAYLSKKK